MSRLSVSESTPTDVMEGCPATGTLSTSVELTEARVDELLGPLLKDRIIWSIRPRLTWTGRRAWDRMNLLPISARTSVRTPARAAVGRAADRLRRRLVRRTPPARTATVRIAMHDGVLRAWSTENHHVALGSPAPTAVIENRWSIEARARTNERQGRLIDIAQSAGFAPHLFTATLNRAVAEDWAIAAFLDDHRPRVVAVSSLEHSFQRLLVWHARQREIPSVYVPHAPTALDREYADLPVDVVLCQGIKDIEYYGGLGGRPDAFRVTGGISMPSRSGEPPGSRRPSRDVVIATTAIWRFEELGELLARIVPVLTSSGLVPVLSPHPREREAVLRLASRVGVRAHAGRTATLLRAGVAAVLAEKASGVLLEAAVSGTPSAHLTGFTEYAFMTDLGIGPFDDRFLRESTSWSDAAAEDLANRSRAWADASGAEAARRIEAALAEDHTLGAPALDSWGILT